MVRQSRLLGRRAAVVDQNAIVWRRDRQSANLKVRRCEASRSDLSKTHKCSVTPWSRRSCTLKLVARMSWLVLSIMRTFQIEGPGGSCGGPPARPAAAALALLAAETAAAAAADVPDVETLLAARCTRDAAALALKLIAPSKEETWASRRLGPAPTPLVVVAIAISIELNLCGQISLDRHLQREDCHRRSVPSLTVFVSCPYHSSR